MIMENIKRQLEELREKVKTAIVSLAKQNCEVELGGLQIRQSFSYYEEEVYHIDKIYIDPGKESVRILLDEYADSIELSEFSIEDQVGIYEELEKTFTNPKYAHRIDFY
jgi:hypothetical protein